MLFFRKTVDAERKTALAFFQQTAGIRFKNLDLLDMAFHHRSFLNESAEKGKSNNERLEFLGDAVLGMVTASFLYESMREKPEGDLAKIKSVVVSEAVLSEIAVKFGVDTYLVLGRGEELSGGRAKKAILADALEAVIGALYLDSGYKAVERFVLSFIIDEVTCVQENRHHLDYKTLLQELVQKKYKVCPLYELTKRTGPDHDRTFWVNVQFCDISYGPASGKNKKEAEQGAAKLAWEAINPEEASLV